MKGQKTIQRVTAWLLSAIMVLGGMPVALAEEVTTPDEAPALEETAAPEETSAPEDVPAPEEVPAPEKVPAPEETPEPEDVPAPEETPAPEEVPVPEETPEPEDVPAPEETPVPEEVPVPEETPEPEDVPAPEETPVPEQTPCTHANFSEYVHENTTSVNDNGDGTHTATYDTVLITYCLDCYINLKSEPIETGLIRRENHEWTPEGYCLFCNAENTCAHEHTETLECARNWEYRDNGDGKTHTKTYEKGTQTHCLDCGTNYGEVWEETVTTETENHNWNSEGVCWNCGVVNTCTHEHTETLECARNW